MWLLSSILGDLRFQSTLILQPLGNSCSSSSPTLSLEGETEKDLAGGEEDLAGGLRGVAIATTSARRGERHDGGREAREMQSR